MPALDADIGLDKRRSKESEHQELARPTSRYYSRPTSSIMSSTISQEDNTDFNYHYGGASKKRRLSWRRSYPEPLPEPAQGLVFHIYRTSPPLSKKVYDITLGDRKTQAFHVTFPHTAFGLSSRPDILVQRGGSSGPVVGEVRYHSWNNDEVLLPLISDSVAKLTSDGFFKKGRKIRCDGKDWCWRQVSSGGQNGVGENLINGHWKCTDPQGAICGLVSRTTTSAKKVGKIAVTQDSMEDKEIEAFVVCAVAILEKEQRRGSTSSSEGD